MSSETSPEREFERLKTSMVSLISHELRTPLTYISASLEMLEMAYENPDLQGEVKRFLKIIDQGVKQLNASIDELLTFSSLENEASGPPAHSGDLNIQAVNLQQLVLEVVNILKPSYTHKKQVLEVAIAEDLPELRVDSSKLSEILLQLLSNAIKFTPTEGHIRVLVVQNDSGFQIVISDTGPGIPPEIHSLIFDPFYQCEDYLIRENGGLGLGLTLVQRLCHAIGARLDVLPEEGLYTGTNFVVHLPQRQSPESNDLQQAMTEMQKLSRSNAEKDKELNSLKTLLLKYTDDLQRAHQSNEQKQSALENMYFDMMSGFAAALEVRDPFTRGRSQRLASYAQMLAEELELDHADQQHLQQACLLCDIGYLGISDEVLHKANSESLSPEEQQHIRTHPLLSAEMLSNLQIFEPVVPLILHHHENFDGSGYPKGVAGTEIPFLSRIIRVVDAFDAMVSDRSFRPRFTPAYAIREIQQHSGSQFDPEIVKLFTDLWKMGRLEILLADLNDQKANGV